MDVQIKATQQLQQFELIYQSWSVAYQQFLQAKISPEVDFPEALPCIPSLHTHQLDNLSDVERVQYQQKLQQMLQWLNEVKADAQQHQESLSHLLRKGKQTQSAVKAYKGY